MKWRRTNLVMNSNEVGAPARTAGSVLLDGYMLYMPDGGLGLDLFVEGGGRLVGQEQRRLLLRDRLGLDEKIEELRGSFPRLSRQLEFLADFTVWTNGAQNERARNEAVFALIYCAKDYDLIPDSLPEIGYADDAAVAKLVLARNAPAFEAHCRARGFDWPELCGAAAVS